MTVDAMTMDTFLKLAIPAVSILVGAATTAAIYSWKLSGRLTSIDGRFVTLHDKMDSEAKLREARDELRAQTQTHQTEMLRHDVALLTARVGAIEEAHKPPK